MGLKNLWTGGNFRKLFTKLGEQMLSFRIFYFVLTALVCFPVWAGQQWSVDLSSRATGDFSWTVKDDKHHRRSSSGRWGTMPEKLTFQGINFVILNQRQNPGRTALILAGKQRGTKLSNRLELDLPTNAARQIALLHTQMWPEGGHFANITAIYADGKKEKIKLVGSDCALDWHNCDNVSNGRVALRSDRNPDAGLYASIFTLRGESPVRLLFELKSDRPVWMIAAVTLLKEPVKFPRYDTFVLNDSGDFFCMRFSSKTIPDSPLDFSFLTDAPAGKYGHVQVSPSGGFCFEKAPEKSVRFHGMNLFRRANFPTKEQAVELAAELVRSGYNLVRLHCGDDCERDGFLIRKQARNSLDFDPEMLDRMDFFIAEAKKRGLYIAYDFAGIRRFLPDDGIEDRDRFCIQRQMPFNPKALENVKAFNRKLLTHVNPYTGMSLAEDPAVAFVHLINEDNITAWLMRDYNQLQLRISQYRKLRNIPKTQKITLETPEFIAWLYECQMDSLRKLKTFAREELKIKAPISVLNFKEDPYLQSMREEFDYVDNHAYYDHPTFPGRTRFGFPYHHHQKSALVNLAAYPRTIMPSRCLGRPFTLTEYSYAFPNRFRSEGGPLLGAYSCLQNYDALVCFAWTSFFDKLGFNHPVNAFSVYNDPIKAFSNRIVSLLFLQKLVAPAKESYQIPVPADVATAVRTMRIFTDEQSTLGLIAQIGSTTKKSSLPHWDQTKGRIRSLYENALKYKHAVSSTGELELNVESKVFTVNTPRAVCLVQHQGKAQAGPLTIAGVKDVQTVALFAMDEKTLSESNKLLLFHLTDSANVGNRYTSSSRRVMTEFGAGGKLLIRKGTCEAQLMGKYTVTALGLNGKIKQPVPVTYKDGKSLFKLDTAQQGGTLVYQLTKADDSPY